jgi:hypothetical protein
MQTTCHSAGWCNIRRSMYVTLITTILPLFFGKRRESETGPIVKEQSATLSSQAENGLHDLAIVTCSAAL